MRRRNFPDLLRRLSAEDYSFCYLPSFFCLRRGLLVNLNHVERITRTDCILDNGEVLPVARGVYKELNEAFINLFKNA